MDDKRKQSTAMLDGLQRLTSQIALLCGLTFWTLIRPPPEYWLPTTLLAFFTSGIVLREIILWRQPKKPPPDPP